MAKSYNIPSFLKYININGKNDDGVQVIHYDEHKNILLKSPPVQLEFYLIAIKNNIDVHPPVKKCQVLISFLINREIIWSGICQVHLSVMAFL